jgi:hypothetical protein
MLVLTDIDYQKLVLMVGSKKALGTYLGLDPKQTDELWRDKNLMSPLTWIKSQDRTTQLEMLAKKGSLAKLADYCGCSEAALRPIFMGEPVRELDWTEEFLLEQFDTYRSVRLVAHVNDVNDSLVRKCVEKYELELTDLIDYSVGANSVNKGRRAELEFARLRGSLVTEDKNLTCGSQADYDFDDAVLGRVNVKSSRQYSYRAQTRKGDPLFWKISGKATNCDTIVAMCYDKGMEKLVGISFLKAGVWSTSSITLKRKHIFDPSAHLSLDLLQTLA